MDNRGLNSVHVVAISIAYLLGNVAKARVDMWAVHSRGQHAQFTLDLSDCRKGEGLRVEANHRCFCKCDWFTMYKPFMVRINLSICLGSSGRF